MLVLEAAPEEYFDPLVDLGAFEPRGIWSHDLYELREKFRDALSSLQDVCKLVTR